MGPKFKIIISMAIFGTISIFVKNIPISTGEISLFRAIIGFLSIAVYQVFSGNRIKLREIKKDLPILFLSGAAMGFNWILLFQAYRYTTVSLATLSYYFAPVLLIILSAVFLREKLSTKGIICFVMASLGLILIISSGGLEKSTTTTLGIVYGLGAAGLYATVIFLNKLIKKVTGIDRTLIQFIGAIIVLTPYVVKTTGINIFEISSLGLVNLLVLGVFHTGFTYCIYFSSVKNLKGQEAAILSYVDPLVSIIISVAVLGESISMLQIIGGAMILGFTLLNELKLDLFRNPRMMIRPNAENGD
ncbi:EamA/RhaT family transporter [Tissierella creatinini]|nr:EamA/RhaT family transporter [Tissierella creatinini]TJX60078.1 EamA/RhaT family transporter [Soehngenia saccharolytica]